MSTQPRGGSGRPRVALSEPSVGSKVMLSTIVTPVKPFRNVTEGGIIEPFMM
jgi:hypothetical protein